MNILITGATGNVGKAIIKSFSYEQLDMKLIAGVRNYQKEKEKLNEFNVSLVEFDFENSQTFHSALKGIDTLFLLRPPQLADVEKYFKPLIDAIKKSKVSHIIFLSVQGVEKSKIIPHHKIEKLIVDNEIAYTFLRPAYFMQNFTTALHTDLVKNKRIFLPSGDAKFTLIDLDDVGKVAAKILADPSKHINTCYDLTNNETLSFAEMANKLSSGLGKEIRFISPSLIQFFLTKRKEGMPIMFIMVMIMLHYLPRFQPTPKISPWVKNITGQEPQTFDSFVSANLSNLQ